MADDAPRTAGMIALVPTAEDAERLAVPSGDDPDKLHLTLVFLGDDVTGWDGDTVDQLTTDLDAHTTGLGGPLSARVMGHGHFNPDGGPNGDMDPCAVYLVGDTSEVPQLRDAVMELLARHGLPVGEQHTPFQPHINGGFGLGPTALSETGPVTFDRLRLALGDQEVDVPLGEDLTELDDDYQPPTPIPVDETEVKEHPAAARDSGDIGTYKTSTQPAAAAGVEVKVASPDPRAVKLRAYWAHGEGLAKWFRGLGVPGNFRRLRSTLAKYVQQPRMLDGLTANVFHEATGQWPGKHGHKALPGAELKSLWDDEPDDAAAGDEQAMCEGIDEWGQEFLDGADDVEDPDGEHADPAGPAPVAAGVEEKATPPAATVTIPAADLVDLFPDGGDDPGAVDPLMLGVDAAILAGDQIVPTEDPDDESWVDVASRDQRYEMGADAVLEPVADQDQNRWRLAPPAAVL